MFEFRWFKSHSGLQLPWKINCDSLTDYDWRALAQIIDSKLRFGEVVGVSMGGMKFAAALDPYVTATYNNVLIVDDVLTTGESMEQLKAAYSKNKPVNGVVVFARSPCADWIWPIFQVSDWCQAWGKGLG